MDVLDTINTRTMVREYDSTPLKEEEKTKILESAIRAPTAAGNEQWIFVRADTNQKMSQLYKLLVEAQSVYFSEMLAKPWDEQRVEQWLGKAYLGAFKAPFYVMVFVDLREHFCTRPPIEEFWAQQSVAAAIENMLLAAWGMGIGGCWYGVPLLIDAGFYELAGMDKDKMKLAAVLGFGYPKEKQEPRPRRKGLKDVVISI